MSKEPLDPRSTYRKRLRRALLMEEGRLYWCEDCGRTNKRDGELVDGVAVEVPPEAEYYEALGALQANHISKDISDCDTANGEWLCASCHKVKDSKTAKGVIAESFGYGFPTGED